MAKGKITVKAPDIRRFTVDVTGLAPGLLTHRHWDESDLEERGITKTEVQSDVEMEAELGLYHLEDPPDGAEFGIPTAAFKKAIIAATRNVQGNVNMTDLRQSVFVPVTHDSLFPIFDAEPLTHTAQVGMNQSGRVMRGRPLFPEGWRVPVVLEYHTAMITQEALLNLLEIAGRCVGVGDWRPEKEGEYGRFTVAGANVQEE